MKESRFIELLNLYVDQQLSAQEASELEAEIQRNPARHRTYRQYCQMQKACTQLFEHERAVAPASTALARAMADADRKVIAFPANEKSWSMWPMGFSLGAVAAAACVALVIIRKDQTAVPATRTEVAVETKPSIGNPAGVLGAVAIASPESRLLAPEVVQEFTPVFKVQPLRSLMTKEPDVLLVGSQGAGSSLGWTNTVQFAPLQKSSTKEFLFDLHAPELSPGLPQFSPVPADETASEMTAIMFTK